MHFCVNCRNMYYIQTSEDNPNALEYYCRKCGHTDTNIKADNISISKVQLKKTEQQFSRETGQEGETGEEASSLAGRVVRETGWTRCGYRPRWHRQARGWQSLCV